MNESDFERVYAENWGPVFAYAMRRTGSQADAAEATSEVFMTLWRRRAAAPALEGMRPWLFGIARNAILNVQRGDRRRSRLGVSLAAAVSEQHPDIAQVIVDRDECRAILAAVALLPESQRELLLLIAWDGLTPAQAAEALGLNPTTVRVRLHRARKQLRLQVEVTERDARTGHVHVDGRAPIRAGEST